MEFLNRHPYSGPCMKAANTKERITEKQMICENEAFLPLRQIMPTVASASVNGNKLIGSNRPSG